MSRDLKPRQSGDPPLTPNVLCEHHQQRHMEHRNQRPARGLIIEDEPVIAADIQHILMQGGGYSVVGIAGTQREAMRIFERERPDFVMADLQLADGSSGLAAIADMRQYGEIPVVFVTAFPKRLLTADRPEPTFLVTKPFQPETLVKAVDQLLQRSGGRSRPSEERRALNQAVAAAILALNKVEPGPPSEQPSDRFGDNQPLASAALSQEDYQAVGDVLRDLLSASTSESSAENWAAGQEVLEGANRKIGAWSRDRRHSFKRATSIRSGRTSPIGK